MPLEIKTFNCPKCGTPLDLKNAGRSKSIVCPSCGSQIDLTSPEYNILGNVGKRMEPQVTPFQLGMRGTISGQEYEIIGRAVYRDDEGDVWDEWLLLSAAGEYVWISDSANEGMALWHSFVPMNPVEPGSLQEDQSLVLRKTRVTVRDAGGMKIDYLEGELNWKATVGERVRYAEADSASERISIEYSQDEVEFYWGEDLDRNATAKAFGVTAPLPTGGTMRGKASVGILSGAGGIFVAIICIAGLCIGIAVMSGGSSSASSAPICTTPTPDTAVRVVATQVVGGASIPVLGQVTPTPGATPTPACFVPTRAPSSGGFFFLPSSGGSIRSGSGGRSPSGGGGSRGGGK